MEHNTGDRIHLTVPATPVAVRIARAGAAALATRAGFSYREGEDLRQAVGEAAALLASQPDGDGRLEIVYDLGDGALRVDLHLADRVALLLDVPAVAAAVLDASVDSWELSEAGRRIVLYKHAAPDADD